MQLLFATHNRGKWLEAQQILSPIGIELLSPEALPEIVDFDVEEVGETLAENAQLKAHAFAQKTQQLTLSDDSGLEVEALQGAPGVKSKRYVPGSDQNRNQALLQALAETQNRAAQFRTVLCLYDPVTNEEQIFDGLVKGKIAWQARGSQGFGYDPIFIPDGFDQTFGELGGSMKNQLSHRSRALEKLIQFLNPHLGGGK